MELISTLVFMMMDMTMLLPLAHGLDVHLTILNISGLKQIHHSMDHTMDHTIMGRSKYTTLLTPLTIDMSTP